MSFCKYKHIFGKEKEGVHKYRILFTDIALVDVTFTIIIACIISYITNWNVLFIILVLFIFAIFIHRLFCVNTTINKMIFGEI